MSQDAGVEETKAVAPTQEFAPSKDDELLLKDEWTLYEQRDVKNWNESIAEVSHFSAVEGFWRIWKALPHSDPQNFFTYKKTDDKGQTKLYSKQYQVNEKDSMAKISTLCWFKKGIKPEWEDLANTKGGCFSYKPENKIEFATKFWQSMVFACVTNNIPHGEEICGFRLVEKGEIYKFEIWVKYGYSAEFGGFSEQSSYLDKMLSEILDKAGAKFDFFKHVK